MATLLSKLTKPFVERETYVDIRDYFGLAKGLSNPSTIGRMLRLSELIQFDRKYPEKLSLITREEIAYVAYSAYSVLLTQFITTRIQDLSDQDFQTFQSISIYILRNDCPRTQEEVQLRADLHRILTEAIRHRTLPEERHFAILDVFLHSCQDPELRRRMEQELEEHRHRQNAMVRANAMAKIPTSKYDISTDSQNVHDTILNTLYRRKLIALSKDVIPDESPQKTVNKYRDMCVKQNIHPKKLIFAFDRILTDMTQFSPTKLTLGSIFQRVYYRVLRLEKTNYFKDALTRIEDECIDMQSTCNTGHMTRLLNILNGYPEIDIEVVAYYTEEIERTIRDEFEKENETNEELMDSYISFGEERKLFENWCTRNLNGWYKRLYYSYVMEKTTHTSFLFMEDFLEAYNKFSGLTFNKHQITPVDIKERK